MAGFRPPRLTTFQTIILLFAAVILAGSLLLMLPVSARDFTVTPFHQASFTATSAVCSSIWVSALRHKVPFTVTAPAAIRLRLSLRGMPSRSARYLSSRLSPWPPP